jgi:hypothetical protein
VKRWAQIAAVIAGIAAVPLLWRPVFETRAPESARATPSYLPALEPARAREPFDPVPIEELRAVQPGIVVIGDSMAGRIHKRRLEELAGTAVAPILRNATGSAHWFLIFKNYVVASGVRPRAVVVFFRETNLTDPMFRLGDPYRVNADYLARDVEPELNAAVASRTQGAWFRAHGAVERAYQVEQTRRWLEPGLAAYPARVVAGDGAAGPLLETLNTAFALDRLRPAAAADMAAAGGEPLDFHRDVQRSVLPAFIALAREHGIRLIFVRILRRPEGGRAPAEPPALQQYIRDLGTYLASHDVIFRDDRYYPGMAALPYDDGDHISRVAMVPYTELFHEQMAAHLR